jgi:hypothetical protein
METPDHSIMRDEDWVETKNIDFNREDVRLTPVNLSIKFRKISGFARYYDRLAPHFIYGCFSSAGRRPSGHTA